MDASNAPELYTIKWETTETQVHHATVTIDELATMIGCSVDEIRQCGGQSDRLSEVDVDGERGLVSGLADIEDSDTEHHVQGPEREVTTLRLARDREIAAWVAAQGVVPPVFSRVEYCEARARKGTGEGTCDHPLDAYGQCPRASDHI